MSNSHSQEVFNTSQHQKKHTKKSALSTQNSLDSIQDDILDKDMQWAQQRRQLYGKQSDIGQRDYNEDKIYLIDTLQDALEPFGYHSVFVILDGHSGIWAVKFLEANFDTYIRQNLVKQKSHDNIGLKAAISGTFQQIDKAVIKHLRDNYDKFGSEARYCGSSTTLIFLGDKRFTTANAGDSGACLGLVAKQSIVLTQWHRVIGEGRDIEAEIERVRLNGGWVTAGRVCDVIAVSRSLGDFMLKADGLQEFLELGIKENRWSTYFAENTHFNGSDMVSGRPAIKHVEIKPEHAFIIAASDGLWDVMTMPEAVSFSRKLFQQGRNCQEVANQLIEKAIKNGTEDNTSVIVILLNNGDWIGQIKSREYSFLDVLMCGFGSGR